MCGYVTLRLTHRPLVPSEDEFGPPRVPSGYRSQTPPSRYRDEYDDDHYNAPAPDNRYAPARSQQRGQYGNEQYELSQTNGASKAAAGDINTMPGYLAEVHCCFSPLIICNIALLMLGICRSMLLSNLFAP